MTKEVNDCRAEEERLQGARAAIKVSDDLRASLVAAKDVSPFQPGSAAHVRASDCATPPVAQIKKCDDFQQDFKAKFCMRHRAVPKVTDEYTECRATTIKALDDTYPIIAEGVKHSKADYTAVRHVQCLLKVLNSPGGDKAQGLKDCIHSKVDIDQLTIEKPPLPDAMDKDFEPMIKDIVSRHIDITVDLLVRGKVISFKLFFWIFLCFMFGDLILHYFEQ